MKEDKIERLFHMMDHPEDYSDSELETLLDDEEVRQCYELTVMAERGFRMDRMASHPQSRLLKIAAMFVGILMLSGIAIAAVQMIRSGSGDITPSVQETHETDVQRQAGHDNGVDDTSVRTFENVELQQILQELSAFYHVDMEFRNEQVRHVRLYTKWDTTAPLAQMIERLNGFEKVSVRLSNNLIIAE